MKKVLSAIAACLLVAAPAAGQDGQDRQEGQDGQILTTLTSREAYAAGLLDEPIPELVIPIDELVSREELLERLERMTEDAGGSVHVAEPFITPDVARILEAIEAGDDDRLRDVLSDVAGAEVTLPTDDHLRQHDEGAIYKPQERYPTDDILARMRPERVEALADYRHLLDEERKLIDALASGNLDSPTRSAVREFLAKMYEPEPIESMMPPELKEHIRQAQERGWYEVASPARGPRLLREASQRELGRSSLSDYGEWIPETAASYSFDLPGDGRIEVVADTRFGGVLYAEKSEADGVYPDDPNLRILGHDGSVTTSRYADGVWATTVIAFDGSHQYRITVERRLVGEERAEFVRMATAMIEGDLSEMAPRRSPLRVGDDHRATHSIHRTR